MMRLVLKTLDPLFERVLYRPGRRAEKWLLSQSPRERYLVFAAVMTLGVVGWYYAAAVPTDERIAELEQEISGADEQLEVVDEEISTLEQELAETPGPDERIQAQIEAIESRIDSLTAGDGSDRLENIAPQSPDEAINTLQGIMLNAPGVRLTRFYRQPGVNDRADTSDEAQSVPIAHRRMEVIFEAGFGSTLALLDRLERTEIPVIWRSIAYKTERRDELTTLLDTPPQAVVTVRFDIYATQPDE